METAWLYSPICVSYIFDLASQLHNCLEAKVEEASIVIASRWRCHIKGKGKTIHTDSIEISSHWKLNADWYRIKLDLDIIIYTYISPYKCKANPNQVCFIISSFTSIFHYLYCFSSPFCLSLSLPLSASPLSFAFTLAKKNVIIRQKRTQKNPKQLS